MTFYLFLIFLLTFSIFLCAESKQNDTKTINKNITVHLGDGKNVEVSSNKTILFQKNDEKRENNGTDKSELATGSGYSYRRQRFGGGQMSPPINMKIGPQLMNANGEFVIRPIRIKVSGETTHGEFDDSYCISEHSSAIKQKKYCIHKEKVNWYQAWINCNSDPKEGSRFATINNKRDQKEIALASKSGSVKEKVWIAGNDLGKLNLFSFISACEPMTFTKWERKPASKRSSTERCVALGRRSDRQWEVLNCNENHYYACEC